MSNMKSLLFLVGCIFLSIGIFAWTLEPVPKSVSQSSLQINGYEKVLEDFDLSSRMRYYGVPGVSFAVIKNGTLDWAMGYGVLQEGFDEQVTTKTLFSVGSVSKVGAATISLRFNEEGLLDIDEDVNKYLTSWKVPVNRNTQKQAVTLRHIMSHTAGLTVHGFADYYPDEKLPSTVQTLKGEWPAKNGQVYVSSPVGSIFRYSGGGTTLAQLIIEDLTSKPFHAVADSHLFQPLNMQRSTYENPLPEGFGNIAKAHDRRGNPVALPRGYQSMPETAASGLWTTPSDFSMLMIMLMQAYHGEETLLSLSAVRDMMTPVSPGSYGLGPRIEKVDGDIRFSHGGSNESYKAEFIGSMRERNGIIIFTNGAAGAELIDELMPLFKEMLF